MKRLSIILVFILFFLVGCSETPNTDVNRNAELIKELNQTKAKLDNANNEIGNLKIEISDLQKKRENNGSTPVFDNDPIFKWIHDSNWDEIIITEYYPDYDVEKPEITEYKINDSMVNTCPSIFFFGIIRYTQPPDPGSGGLYKYIFNRGSESYSIDIYDSHCFNYEGTFYCCIGTIDDYAKAFITDHEGFNNYKNYLEFIYNSTALIGEKIYTEPFYFKHRIQSIAKELSKFHEIRKPDLGNVDGLIETFSFFNHGETAKVIIYEDYVNIDFQSQDIWLQGDAQSPPISLTYILGAN